MYHDDFLDQVRNASPIETIAASYVNLKRRGRTYVCSCPFHSEKSPSCTIYPDTQSFYCFGCGAGGDVFTWIRRIENIEFTDAVKLLADKAGLQVPNDHEAEQKAHLRTQVFAINREAANFFYRNLVAGMDKRGLQYFISRNLKPKTIQKYGLGFAADDWTSLTDYLLKKGFTEDELIIADVAHRSNRTGKIYDTFRNRVIFPIVDTRGAVIGFGGRVMDDSQPKYLNTAETPVFDKGRNLFSLNFAKDSDSTHIILAEGYMDVISINQAGFSNVVATLGTAITPDQARQLSHYAKEIIIAYDNDGPGQQAAQRAINRFNEVGLPTRILHMMDAKDPDEYIKKFGADRFRMLLERAGDAINFQLDRCEVGLDTETEAGKVQLLKRMIPILAEIENPLTRDVYISRTAAKWEIAPDVLRKQVEEHDRSKRSIERKKDWNRVYEQTVHPVPAKQMQNGSSLKELRAEERILVALLNHPAENIWITKQLQPEQFTQSLYRRVFVLFQENSDSFTLSSLGNVLSTDEMGKIIGIQAKQRDFPTSRQEIEDCIRTLQQQSQAKAIETDEDLLSLIQKKQNHP